MSGNLFDPSVAKPGENYATYEDMENEVSLAYSVSIGQLDVLLKMVSGVEKASKGDGLEALKRYREFVIQDVRRLEMRLHLSKEYLQTQEMQFHYHVKRRRTQDRADRLRLWNREKLKKLEGVQLQLGDVSYQAGLAPLEEERRVMIRCYDLEKVWERAMAREMKSVAEGDDLSSGADTDLEE